MHSQAIMSMVMNIAITICVEILTANDVIVFSGSRHVRGVFRIKCAGQNNFRTVYAREMA